MPSSFIGSNNGETFEVNADGRPVGDVNSFATGREAVSSVESSIHQLSCHTASATLTERKHSFNDACGIGFSSAPAPLCADSDLGERHFNIGSDVEDGGLLSEHLQGRERASGTSERKVYGDVFILCILVRHKTAPRSDVRSAMGTHAQVHSYGE